MPSSPCDAPSSADVTRISGSVGRTGLSRDSLKSGVRPKIREIGAAVEGLTAVLALNPWRCSSRALWRAEPSSTRPGVIPKPRLEHDFEDLRKALQKDLF